MSWPYEKILAARLNLIFTCMAISKDNGGEVRTVTRHRKEEKAKELPKPR